MTKPIALEEAWQRLLAPLSALPREDIPVDEAGGRYLLDTLAARRTQPYADLSAMDGFAARGAAPWRIVGEARAGTPFAGTLGDGEATRISTGAALPRGAEAIVPLEEALSDGDRLASAKALQPGRHIRRAGFDFSLGDLLIPVGSRLTAPRIALARAGGHATVLVARRPRVAILECGDELVADPAACPPNRQPASNGAMLAHMVESAGGTVQRFDLIADCLDAHVAAIAAAGEADILVTTGGASVGEHDLVRPALERLGYAIDVWRVAIRPGKPLIVARRGAQLMLGLPGNPVSSFVTAYLFMCPAIRELAGTAEALPRPVALPLATDLPPGGTRREFLRATLGHTGVIPIAERDSSALAALAGADLLIDRAPHAPWARAGTSVPCYWLENGAIA